MSVVRDPETVILLESAVAAARRGNLSVARTSAEDALALGREPAIVLRLLGAICCEMGDLDAGARHLRAALDAMPDDVATRNNLATALLQHGDDSQALALCDEASCDRDTSLRLWRMRAYLLLTAKVFDQAEIAYERIIAILPDDFESWNNLGNARAAFSDGSGSASALRKAARLRPDFAPTRLNLAATLREIGEWDEAMAVISAGIEEFPGNVHFLVELARLHEAHGRQTEALDAIGRAAALDPQDPDLQVALGTGLIAAWNMKAAADALNRAVALDPSHSEAHIQLAVLHEHDYLPDNLRPLIAAAEARSVDAGAIALMDAMALGREGRFEEALAALRRVPDDIQPIRRALLAGQFEDRLGQADAAIAAFSEMNRLHSLDPSKPLVRADSYREALERDIATVTSEWFAGWTPPASSVRPSPVFLVGFPRSGTTLLDTLLMGHPDVTVLEEKPSLRKVEEALGGIAMLPALDVADIERLRAIYFEEAAVHVDLDPKKLLVDKLPLHLNKVPIIHRLFPDARFILALRHPCDVVLSCFITNFQLNDAMASYLSLENTARIYDLSFGFWERTRSIMPILSHSVKYEGIVSNIAAELRPLFDYLGLHWHEETLDHRRTAKARGVISTPSYVQVTEPIYDRSSGRWNRYRALLEPLFPVLKPWIERYGYAQ